MNERRGKELHTLACVRSAQQQAPEAWMTGSTSSQAAAFADTGLLCAMCQCWCRATSLSRRLAGWTAHIRHVWVGMCVHPEGAHAQVPHARSSAARLSLHADGRVKFVMRQLVLLSPMCGPCLFAWCWD